MRRLFRLFSTVAIVALVLLVALGQRAVAEGAYVDGSSMEPTFHNGQYVMLDKTVYLLSGGPHRGDVIVFRYPLDPSRDFIKRVIGVPGDSVEMRNGVLLINDKPVPEDYLPSDIVTNNFARVQVPAYDYFVLGDNRGNSSDSRVWGFVPRDNIIGKEVFSYWPLGGDDHRLDFEVLGRGVSIPLP
jgi:signal peptidase I